MDDIEQLCERAERHGTHPLRHRDLDALVRDLAAALRASDERAERGKRYEARCHKRRAQRDNAVRAARKWRGLHKQAKAILHTADRDLHYRRKDCQMWRDRAEAAERRLAEVEAERDEHVHVNEVLAAGYERDQAMLAELRPVVRAAIRHTKHAQRGTDIHGQKYTWLVPEICEAVDRLSPATKAWAEGGE